MAGVVMPDSKKSLSPVNTTSAFASIAARRIGRSSTSLIFSSVPFSSVGIGTSSSEIKATERKRSSAERRFGNFC